MFESARRLSVFGLWCLGGLALSACALLSCSVESETPDLAMHRGNNALAEGRPAWARRYFAEDLVTFPQRQESHSGLARAWLSDAEGSLSQGVAAWERYLELAPTDQTARRYLAKALLQLGQADRAREIVLPSDAPESLTILAQADLDTDPERALITIERAIELRPTEPLNYRLAAQIALRLAKFDHALESAQEAVRLDPLDADASFLEGTSLRRLDRGAEAATAFERFERLSLSGSNTGIGRSLGRPAVNSGRDRIETWLEVVGSEPEVWPAAVRVSIARALLDAGELHLARRSIEVIVEEPGYGSSPPNAQLLALARAARARSLPDPALRLVEGVLKQDPDDPAAWALRADLELDAGQLDAAAGSVERGLTVAPHRASLHYLRGRVALLVEGEAASLPDLERALLLAPWNDRYRTTLAAVHRTLGDPQAADEVLSGRPTGAEREATGAVETGPERRGGTLR